MRLINADALDYEVMHFFMTITGNPKQSTVVNECKRSFRNMIDEQPTVKAAPNWIPCSERLPECDYGYESTEGVLFQLKSGSIEVGFYGTGGKQRDKYFRVYRDGSEGFDARDVVAWMPLPEPYKLN